MTLLPKVKLKSQTNFPSTVEGRFGIDVVRSNGNFYIDLDYSEFASLPVAPLNTVSLFYDPLAQSYVLAPAVAGNGDVTGPVTSGADRIAVFNGTTGKIIKDGGTTVAALSSRDTLLATDSGSANLISLTLAALPAGLAFPFDGMRIRFKANFTSTSAGYLTVTITQFPGPVWNLTQPDGYTLAFQYDIQLGQTVTIEYLSAQGVWALITPPATANNFTASVFTHGMYKLQAGGAGTEVHFDSNDGGMVLGWDTTTSSYRAVRLGPSGAIKQNVFNGTALVDGVANQSLANQLYWVTLEPQSGTTDPANPAGGLSFYSATSGLYLPTVSNAYGIYTLQNNGVPDPTRIILGLVRPVSGSILNNIGPANAMGNSVYSHSGLSRWVFGYQTNVVSCTASSPTLTTQTTPSIYTPTEGITDCPSFRAKANVTGSAGAVVASMRIVVSGTTLLGAPFTSFSPTAKLTTTGTGVTGQLICDWESAPPAGFYTAQVQIAIASGTCQFDIDMLGRIPI